jgi:hypothetical protein
MAPTSEDFCVFSAYADALSLLFVREDGTVAAKERVEPSLLDKSLFAKIGRYGVIHQIAPHMSMDMRLFLFITFRNKVSDVLKKKFERSGEQDYDAKSLDPVLIRNWISLSPMGEDTQGLCGLGTCFAWSEPQKDFLAQLWDELQSIISVEAGKNAKRMQNAKQSVARDYSFEFCQVCDPGAIQISSNFSGDVDALAKELWKENEMTVEMVSEIEGFLKSKQDFLAGPSLEKFRSKFFDESTPDGAKNCEVLEKMFSAAAKERKAAEEAEAEIAGSSGAGAFADKATSKAKKKVEAPVDLASMQERIFKDLVRLNDHLYILLPDLCRRLCDAQEGGPFADKVKIMDRVAPHVSKQYRNEQTDLTMLENTRRLRFERVQLAEQLVEELLNGKDEPEVGGLKLAKCPPGCAC